MEKFPPEESSRDEESTKPQNKIKLKIKFKLAERKEETPAPKVVKPEARSKKRTKKSPKDESFRDDEPLIRIVPSLRKEHRNGDASDEEKVPVDRSDANDGEDDGKFGSIGKEGKIKRKLKNKEKRKIEKVDEIDKDDEGEEEEGKSVGDSLYNFPMNRISRIIKSEILDHKISQEAVFVINRATEKFLELFSKEAHKARASPDPKKCIAYNHLSSVVSKRRRFEFLSDFVPEKIRAEEALARTKQSEECE